MANEQLETFSNSAVKFCSPNFFFLNHVHNVEQNLHNKPTVKFSVSNCFIASKIVVSSTTKGIHISLIYCLNVNTCI